MRNFVEFKVCFYIFVASLKLSANQDTPSANQLNFWTQSHPADSQPYATNLEGIPIPSLTSSQSVGTSGPVLLQDAFLLDKLASFNRERIPERVVNAKGAGAMGHFTVNNDIRAITKAKFLNQIGKVTKVVARFSTVSGESGSPDTWIGSKGFAVKFFTEEGNYDLVGNNIEVFPIRDPMLFSDINRSRKRNPQTHLRDVNSWWDFITLRPETTLHTLHLFSDIGTPMGYRGMNGAGVHTFKMVNATNYPVYVKFHWQSNQEKRTFTKEASASMAGSNSDFAIQDLYDAIERKEFPSWDLSIQVMTFDQASNQPLNPFDVTKHWRREEFPLILVGKMILDQNHKDYFTGVEQVAFSPSNLVPGIEPSPDRMLHARMFAYPDAQRYRLGTNFAQLPINKPISPVNSYIRDGTGCPGLNGGGGPNYYPNSYHGFKQNPLVQQSQFSLSGDVDRFDTGDADNFSQANTFIWEDVDDAHRQRIVDNIADFLTKADQVIQQRFLKNNAYPIAKEFGDMMKDALDRANIKKKNFNPVIQPAYSQPIISSNIVNTPPKTDPEALKRILEAKIQQNKLLLANKQAPQLVAQAPQVAAPVVQVPASTAPEDEEEERWKRLEILV